MTSIDGVFEDNWDGRVTCRLGTVDTTILGREHLLQNERAVARPKDRIDVRILEQSAGRNRRPLRAGSSKKPKRRR
jgi:hypothetical protein